MECRECKENAVEKDDHNGQEQLVCKACGAVSEEHTFTSNAEEFGGPFGGSTHVANNPLASVQLPWAIKKLQYKTLPQGTKRGLEAVDVLASALTFPSHIRTAVIELFQRAAIHDRLATCSLEKKTALAAACAYLILRCNNWPITISSLCDYVQVPLPMFNDVYKLLITIANLPITSTSLEDQVLTYLKDYKMADSETLTKTTTSIIELEKQLWISTGKKPEGILSASAYFAWMSLDINCRSRFTYKTFCAHTGLRVVSSAPTRYKELTVALSKLTAQLPWLQHKKLEKVHLLQNLTNVLKYSRTLTNTATELNSNSEYEHWNRLLPLSLAKRRRIEMASKIASEERGDETTKLFVSNSPELSESDLPDKELSKYIKTSQEMEKLKADCSFSDDSKNKQ